MLISDWGRADEREGFWLQLRSPRDGDVFWSSRVNAACLQALPAQPFLRLGSGWMVTGEAASAGFLESAWALVFVSTLKRAI